MPRGQCRAGRAGWFVAGWLVFRGGRRQGREARRGGRQGIECGWVRTWGEVCGVVFCGCVGLCGLMCCLQWCGGSVEERDTHHRRIRNC
jgi:hypothetical protein